MPNFARNLRRELRGLSSSQIDRLLDALSPRTLERLDGFWELWARSDQLPPREDPEDLSWRTWLLLGGRGAGKTRAGAEWVRALATGRPGYAPTNVRRIALIAETIDQARAIMVEGVSGILAVHLGDELPKFERGAKRLIWPNGTIAELFSAEDPDSLRGPQFGAAWCDELAKWRHPDSTWDMLQFGLRLGERPRTLVTTTPRPIPLLRRLMADPATVTARARASDNAANLAPGFLEAITERYGGTRLGRQELDAEILEDEEGALWQHDNIEANRRRHAPELGRVVIAVDPPVSSGTRADACGVIVAGRGLNDERAYVLEDATLERAAPAKWSSHVAALFRRRWADCVVAEVNQGGDLVETVLRQADPDLPVRQVRATRGKWLRAEPIALLYARGLVSHVGSHPELEDQMCVLTPEGLARGRSPDRVDALVWALTELMLRPRGRPRVQRI